MKAALFKDLPSTMVVTLIIAIIGWVIAIWKTIVAHKYRKDSVVFENRLRIYNEYFSKIDKINEELTIDFGQYLGPVLEKIFNKILTEPDSIDETLIELNRAASDIVTKSSRTISQATQELQALRFISTQQTLEIINKYQKLAESQTKIISKLFGTIDINNLRSYDENKNVELIEIGKKLLETRNELERQMRIDLGVK